MIFFRKPVPACRDHALPNRSRERSLAFSASTSRSREGAWVCSDVSSRRAASETSATARLNASSLACDGLLKPESFRTNCNAEAWISAWVAGGSKLNSVLMLRHMNSLPHLLSVLPKDGRQRQNPTYQSILAWIGHFEPFAREPRA